MTSIADIPNDDFPLQQTAPGIRPMHRACVLKGCQRKSPLLVLGSWIAAGLLLLALAGSLYFMPSKEPVIIISKGDPVSGNPRRVLEPTPAPSRQEPPRMADTPRADETLGLASESTGPAPVSGGYSAHASKPRSTPDTRRQARSLAQVTSRTRQIDSLAALPVVPDSEKWWIQTTLPSVPDSEKWWLK